MKTVGDKYGGVGVTSYSFFLYETKTPAATCSINEKDIWCVKEPSFRPDQIENGMIVISIPYINL